MEAMSEGVVVSDMKGEFLIWNPAARLMIRQGPLEGGTQTWSHSYGLFEETGKRLLSESELPLYRAIHGEPVENFRILVKYRETQRDVENLISVSARPVLDEKGEQRAAVALIRDITKEEQQKKIIEKAEEDLVRAQTLSALGALTGGIAHDFNNQLTIILGLIQRLRRKETDSDKIKMLDMILGAAKSSADMTSKLKAFGRRQEMKLAPSSLNTVAKESSVLVQSSLSSDWQIELELGDDLPQVEVDTSQLQRVILNLLLNAKDSMENGGAIRLRSFIVARGDEGETRIPATLSDQEYICLSVSDQGTGISSEQINRIFDPFFTTKSAGKGTGLGLSTSYGIIHQFNGDISVESIPNVGSTFNVFLPISGRKKQAAPTTEFAKNAQPILDICILLVEDDPSVGNTIKLLLEDMGASVLYFSNPSDAEAASQAPGFSPDLLISDIDMPEMSGIELRKKIIQRLPNIKTVLISGFHQEILICDPSDNTALLTKPFTAQKLFSTIDEIRKRPTVQNQP